MNQSDERPFRIVHGFTPQNPEFWLAHPHTNWSPSGPPSHVGLCATNIKIWQPPPTPPLATAQSALQIWSSTTIPIPDPPTHTTLTLCTIIVILIQVESQLLTRGQWSDNHAQQMVVIPCLMCFEVATWCRAKMWKWEGGTAKTIGLSRGEVRQVTSRARCWAGDCW